LGEEHEEAVPGTGEPYSFLKLAQSLNLEGPEDWSENLDDYLCGDNSTLLDCALPDPRPGINARARLKKPPEGDLKRVGFSRLFRIARALMPGRGSLEEVESLGDRLGASKGRGGRRSRPYAFTEQGVAMLSSILRTARAVRVNVEVIRVFVRLRHVVSSQAELIRRLDELEQKCDAQFGAVFDALRELMAPPEPARKQIGFGGL
jgi:hypothetical protein